MAIGGERAAVWSLHDKGVALMRLGDYEGAINSLKQAVETNPRNVIFLVDLGYIFEKSDRLKLAEEYYHEAHAIDPDNNIVAKYILNLRKLIQDKVESYQTKASAFNASNQLTEALNMYYAAIDVAGGRQAPWALLEIGNIYTFLNDYEKAEFYFQRAYYYLSTEEKVVMQLANFYFLRKHNLKVV